MKKVSIMIPAYNESESLPALFDKLKSVIENISNYEWEVLFVNDGSSDNTLEVIQGLRKRDERINYIDLSRNFGKELAMMAGFDYVTGDCLVILDADLQHPPELIHEMLKYWEEGYDDVYAQRRSVHKESYFKKKTSKIYYRLLQKLTNIPIQRDTGDFRLLDRSCINALNKMRESQRNTKGMFAWIGYKKKGIFYDQNERFAGSSKWSFGNLLSLAIDGFTAYTVAPLRIASVLGLVISLISFIYGLVIIFKTIFFYEPVQGYPSMMVVILFLGGIQLMSLGIIGEYLGKVFNETKNRPGFFIRMYNDIKL